MTDRILIIGAGPTGLGAAWRLNELGHSNWLLLDSQPRELAGGLAASFTDPQGFTWDLGGHVQFSHYEYFDRLMDDLLGVDGWLYHDRESWVWLRDRFVPYPFQMNIRRLPVADLQRCVDGLAELQNHPAPEPKNFGEWIDATFGCGIAEVFMRPYNYKVWGYAPEKLSYTWIGERVAVVDLQRVLRNIEEQKDDVSWGPNNRFRFPRFGGTGAVWRACASRLPQGNLRFGATVKSIDRSQRIAYLADGTTERFDHMLSTMALDRLVDISGIPRFAPEVARLRYSSTHVFGIGIRGKPREELATKCWMYFPESNCPFYRVTVFSNYSPNNVPDISQYWSLMAEVSESPDKPVPPTADERMEEVVQGMINTRLIESRDEIVDTAQVSLKYGYPTPTLDRDSVIRSVLPQLDRLGIYSRGRFGAWRYEVSNQDHSLMQGVEWADFIVRGTPEVTLWHPEIVNA